MGTTYRMNASTDEVIGKLVRNEIPGLEAVHRPLDDHGMPSLWPEGVRDPETNVHGWFEDDMILFWGASAINATKVLHPLAAVGIKTKYLW